MSKFFWSFLFWLFFWIGGWIILRTIPGGLDLLDRELFQTVDSQFILTVNLLILIATLFTLLFFRFLFGPFLLFHLKPYKLNLALLIFVALASLPSLLYIVFLTDVVVENLLFGFLLAASYYACVTFFQQVINFGLLQEGITKITNSKETTILLTAFLFSFSHFVSIIEGFTFNEVILVVMVSFVLGLTFSFLRSSRKSLIPGFLLHLSFYLLWNGPLFI